MEVQIPAEIIWGLVGYILITTGAFIYWAATTTQQLKTLQELVKDMVHNNALFAHKEDVARELGVIEGNQETMWDRFDKLKEKVDSAH